MTADEQPRQPGTMATVGGVLGDVGEDEVAGALESSGLRRFRRYPGYKDSEVEWLGDIPEHWELKALKHRIRKPLAYGVLKPDKYEGDNGVALIRILDVQAGAVLVHQLETISAEQSDEYSRTVVIPGDLVVSVVGTIGRCFIVPEALAGSNLSRALARVQLRHEVMPRFVEYSLAATPFSEFADLVPIGTAQRVLNLGDLAEYVFPLPRPEEQRDITEFLDRETAKIDGLISRIRDGIRLAKELRTSLVSAAVTGKIDVRSEIA